MDNEYTTKEMKPSIEQNIPKPEETKVVTPEKGIYEEGGRYKFKLEGQVYQYKTMKLAEEGLELLNG